MPPPKPKLNLDSRLIPIWLRDAQPTLSEREGDRDRTERRRVEAVHWLLEFRRFQIRRGGPIDREIVEFLEVNADKIWTSEDPTVELAAFLGCKKSRGRPKTDDTLAFGIAVKIEKLRKSGHTVAAAIQQVILEPGTAVEEGYAKRLYYQQMRKGSRTATAVRADIEMWEMETQKERAESNPGEPKVPPPDGQ